MPSSFRRIALVVPALVAMVGCTPIKPQGKPILTPARMPPHSVGVEIFFVRSPVDDPRLNQQLWSEVDETPFPVESRRLWAQNGFRVGVVAGQIPDVLAELMEMKATGPAEEPVKEPATPQDKKEKEEADQDKRLDEAASLGTEPRVRVRQMNLRPGQRSEVVASSVYDEWPVLTCERGDVSGQTYYQAQGIFGMKIANQRDGRVQLELVPELFYGQSRQRWVGEQGVLRLEAGRPKRAFTNLAIQGTLARGQILAVSCLPNRPGSIGNYFFNDKQQGKIEQKLLLIRLLKTQHDDILPAPDVMPMDNVH
jgi:hypothetical protein